MLGRLGHQAPRQPDWLTIREVARRVSVTPKTVRRWIREGAFDEIAIIHQRMRISPASYHRFMEQRTLRRQQDEANK